MPLADDAEGTEIAGIQQIRRIDDQCAVGGVLALGVCELLEGLNGMLQENIFPEPRLGDPQFFRGPEPISPKIASYTWSNCFRVSASSAATDRLSVSSRRAIAA